MLTVMWLAFTAPPIPLDAALPPLLPPAVITRVLTPPACLAAACARGEWQVAAMPAIPAGQRRIDGDDLPGAGAQLQVAGSRRDWLAAKGSNARVGLQYGVQAVKSDYASLAWAIDTGYRLQAYADDGIAGTGPVLRGQLDWRQSLGERTRLTQTTRVETGQHGTFLRNSLLLRVQLKPDLTLSSGVETRRDSEVGGRNRTDATLDLRYTF